LAVPEAVVTAIAARDPMKARTFAAKHGIARVHESYNALLADPDIDAIYNPLPNSFHCDWTIRALEAGKHVLCEKPMASNTEEAERMAEAAHRCDRILMEAFHYRYHPLARRMKEIAENGTIGAVQHIETHMCIPLPFPNDIRYRLDLAGGATMDVGCYTISLLRFLAGAEPEVTQAQARLASPGVDRYMTARFRFPDGRTARMTCALFAATLLRVAATVRGDAGELRILNPYAPQFFHRLTVRTKHSTKVERLRSDSTYTHQLRAFVAAVRYGASIPTGPAEAIANMRVIDAVYRAAGLTPRGR
jgi:predicted dehydrogenase